MIRIALCDDDDHERESIYEMLSSYFDGSAKSGRVYSYPSARSLINAIYEYGNFDIYVLDIVMPEMNGIELGMRIRENDERGIIIYLTTAPEFALDGYDVKAFHYLLKPVDKVKLLSVLDEAVNEAYDKEQKTYKVHTKESDIILNLEDILYVEQSGRFPHYVCKDGTISGLMLKKSFKEEMAGILGDDDFVLCGASYIVNLYHVKSVDKAGITLSNGSSLSLPKSGLSTLRVAWTNYWLK